MDCPNLWIDGSSPETPLENEIIVFYRDSGRSALSVAVPHFPGVFMCRLGVGSGDRQGCSWPLQAEYARSHPR